MPATTFEIVLHGSSIIICEFREDGIVVNSLFIPDAAVPKFLEDARQITLEDVKRSGEVMDVTLARLLGTAVEQYE